MNMLELGAAIKEARLEKNPKMTLSDLEKSSGVGIAVLSKLENGKLVSDLGVMKLMRIIESVGMMIELRPTGFSYTLDDAHADNENDYSLKF